MTGPHLEYKYVIVGDSGNSNLETIWENIDGNRILNLLARPTDGSGIISKVDQFDNYEKPKPILSYGPQPDVTSFYGNFS